MKNRLIGKIGVLILLVGVISIGMSSCRKKKTTIAKITVLNTDGEKVSNAMVRLWPDIIPDREVVIDDTLFTNGSGEAIFDYTGDFNLGQAGFAILNIEVKAKDPITGETRIGMGLIKIEPEKTNSETVIAQQAL